MGNNHKPSDIVETTDCLEAIGVCRSWKNLSFVFLMLGLVIMQVLFWMVDLGLVRQENQTEPVPTTIQIDANAETSSPATNTRPKPGLFGLTFGDVQHLLAVTNGVVLLAALLFCLSLLTSTMISVVGRLGGLHHICRAFFLSVVMLVLLVPWQALGDSCALGAMFTPKELAHWHAQPFPGASRVFLYYLRFIGYWFIVFIMTIIAQYRTTRWARSILRRLEII